jgi:hypothetical protein
MCAWLQVRTTPIRSSSSNTGERRRTGSATVAHQRDGRIGRIGEALGQFHEHAVLHLGGDRAKDVAEELVGGFRALAPGLEEQVRHLAEKVAPAFAVVDARKVNKLAET